MTKRRVRTKKVKLDIGCGKPGFQRTPLTQWTHFDVMPHKHVEMVGDFGKIDLPDASVDEIYIGDVIEHIPMWRWDEVLCEWNRILKPNGIVRGTTPNFDRAMRDYAAGTLSFRDALTSTFGWGTTEYEQHYHVFTQETLTKLMMAYGIYINDYSGSPGPVDRPWWLVFSGKKVKNVELGINYGMPDDKA